ncbi:NfeD family protein [Biformimicrobium ophioploci]|uniref:Nodulation protein NfeD n=1 Tax=Biformimicrobium ophioploci TaxID=3036711 RepID=A0ABQ6M0Z1_9GAMM|nr:nodulation protein NfeD [Microbulbifer sp. NKW57]GMG88005.1 nodulation protein NfeD [Microbulbifer sp. NKW57]
MAIRVLRPFLSLIFLFVLAAMPRAWADGSVVLLKVDDAIGPAIADYLVRGIEGAPRSGADLVILQMDTPGGLDKSMRDIIKAILASPVPVATFVYPRGARAASAGTYILYASHIAAMSPATNLGAATPVQIGGPPMPGGQPGQDAPRQPRKDQDRPQQSESGDTNTSGENERAQQDQDKDAGDDKKYEPDTAIERKQVNDAVAYIRSLAELRGRNAEWAEKAVRGGVSLSAQAALNESVIDLMANDVSDLLQKINGRTVTVHGVDKVMDTAASEVVTVEPDWRNRFLQTITNPNIAYLLLLIGFYGIILEFYSPGVGVAGTIGALALLTAAYALQMLPVNVAGLAFIALGIGLMVIEMFSPSFGVVGLGGIVAFVMGSIFLIDSEVEAFKVARPLIGTIAALGGAGLLMIMHALTRSRQRKVVTGAEAMIGLEAIAEESFEHTGHVMLEGEIWRARCASPVKKGDRLEVIAVEELWLQVRHR